MSDHSIETRFYPSALSRPSKLLALMLGAMLSMAAPALADNDEDNDNDAYQIGLWGDLPYSDLQANVGVPNLIEDMNAHRLKFTVHDGDLKAGSGACDDAVYTRALGYLNSLEAPAMFTPGDNDWTDCDRNPGVNSLERLDFERK